MAFVYFYCRAIYRHEFGLGVEHGGGREPEFQRAHKQDPTQQPPPHKQQQHGHTARGHLQPLQRQPRGPRKHVRREDHLVLSGLRHKRRVPCTRTGAHARGDHERMPVSLCLFFINCFVYC